MARDVRTELPAGVQVRDVSPEGIPSFVQGPLGRMSPELTGLSTSAVDASLRGALPGVAKLFRLDAAQLVFKRVQQDAFGNTFVRYGQTKNGLPVVNAELLLHVNREGEIFAANGNAHDGSRLASVPTLSEAAALATAREDATRSGSSVRGEPRLVYLRSSLDQALYLAYELRVAGGERDGLPVDELLFVNAQDGALVERHSRIHAALNRRVSSAMNGNSLPGTLKRTEGQAVTGDTFVDGHYDRLGEFYNCYRNNFGRDSYDNAGAALLSTVHYRSNYVNIFWDGTQLVLGDGDNVEARALPLDPDFVTHELTHAVIERTSNLIYSGQSGGLNESLSDILAAFCQSYNSGTWSTSNEVFMIGEASWTPNIPNDALRYLYDPTKDGVSRDFFSGALSNVDPHYSSGVSNLAFTLLARGGWHPKHRSNVNVTGIGVE
ncbi:MAG: M4 family metallopeptidase, partial [Cystobacter sp.]